MVRIGAHVSIAGGLYRAIEKAARIGADCGQIFASSPQRWSPAKHTSDDVNRFLQQRRNAGIDPIFLHTIYLVNLASASEILTQRSVDSLTLYLDWATKLQSSGVVTHLGSAGDQMLGEAERRTIESLSAALLRSASDIPICVETAAGAGSSIGANFAQIGRILRGVGDARRLGLCVDTAHVFAAGYDITTDDGLDRMLEEIDTHVGLELLRVVHLNDAKNPLGSRVDRHENIGRGFIGEKAFARLLTNEALQNVPMIIEVPGFDQEGPDSENIALLRKLAQAQK